jgi:hypothetical protein
MWDWPVAMQYNTAKANTHPVLERYSNQRFRVPATHIVRGLDLLATLIDKHTFIYLNQRYDKKTRVFCFRMCQYFVIFNVRQIRSTLQSFALYPIVNNETEVTWWNHLGQSAAYIRSRRGSLEKILSLLVAVRTWSLVNGSTVSSSSFFPSFLLPLPLLLDLFLPSFYLIFSSFCKTKLSLTAFEYFLEVQIFCPNAFSYLCI